MEEPSVYYVIWEQFKLTSWWEWISTISQVISVFYAQRNNVLVYPSGIVGVIIAAYLYFFVASPPLYAEGSVHLYYFGMSCYGWYLWVQKDKLTVYVYPISWAKKKEIIVALILCSISFLLLFVWLEYFTNSNTSLLDSFVSATAITAMWMMAKRKIENWLFWMASNIVAIPLHVYKGFYLFALMFFLFLLMAVYGYFKWKRELR
ncbi:MAG: nicotinamide riboside transporter PnuC [Saprospiraceae bacterium]